MSSTLRGSKRLQVIQRWLQGIDDPIWEVFPTKKEGKYIVRQRKTPLTPQTQSPEVDNEDDPVDVEETDQSIDTEPHEDIIDNEEPSTPPSKPKPKPKSSVTRKQPQPVKKPQYTSSFDPTINLEILNTLKSLGDEIKREREEKAQKRMMKQVVHKELYGNYNRRTPFNDPYEHENLKPRNNEKIEYDDEYEDEPTPIQQPQPTYPRRRNNIFADIY